MTTRAFAPLRPAPRITLEEVDEPDLIREVYPYDRIPALRFDTAEVPLSPAPVLWLTDTTFRDGQQAREPYTVEQIVRIYQLLHRLDGGAGLIRQSEFFLYTEKDRAAVEALTRGIVAKLLHDPTVGLKDAAGAAGGERLSDAVRTLFGL